MTDQPTDAPKRGRPRASDPRSSSISAAVSVTQHQAVVRAASSARVSVSEYVNRALRQTLVTKR